MSVMQRRRNVVKATKKYGLHVQPKALQAMLEYGEGNGNVDYLFPILETLQGKLEHVSPKIITLDLWVEAVQDVTAAAVAVSEKAAVTSRNMHSLKATDKLPSSKVSSTSNASQRTKNKNCRHPDWKVVDAFDKPTLVYDSLRQQFYFPKRHRGRPSLFGSVEDKVEMMSQRFLRVQQRVQRCISNLTSIDRLLGTNATSNQVLLGLLHSTSTSAALAEAEGVAATGFELEDLTGAIPLQLHSTTKLDVDGVYIDGCVVLIEGYYDEGIFVVNEVKLPPLESRASAKPFIPPLPSTFSSNHAAVASPLTIYSMSNVAVDEPMILQQLEDLVASFCADESSTQVVLVLMGNFTHNTMPMSVALEEIHRIIRPLNANHSVLIMPGPKDTPSMCWPIPPIKAPSSFSQDLQATVEFVSNPCEIQYGDQQDILLYRQDIIQQHLQNEILSVRNSSEEKAAVKGRILHTVLSQGHLSLQTPIYWNYDYALGVYPLPDLMLVGLEEGEDKIKDFEEAECQVIAPGSQGNWAKVTLYPKHKRRGVRTSLIVEFSQDNEDEDEDEDNSEDSVFDSDSMEED